MKNSTIHSFGTLTLAFAILLMSGSVQAGLLQWNVVGTNGVWNLDGFVQIDEADVQDNLNIGDSIVNWAFNWNDGVTFLSQSSAAVGFSALPPVFIVDSSYAVVSANLCTGDCIGRIWSPTWPDIQVHTDFWDASASGERGCCVTDVGSTTAAWNYKGSGQVPAPATLTLICIGLAGVGWSRRKAA